MGKREAPLRAKAKLESFEPVLLWPTQIGIAQYDGTGALNRELLSLIESQGFWTSHYQADGDLWRYEADCPALAELRAVFTDGARQWLEQAGLPQRPVERQHAWTYRYSAGEYVDVHDHANVHLAAVYYIEVPPAVGNSAKQSLRTPKEGGHLVFHDCRRGISDIVREWGQKPFHAVRPREGMLVTFPGYLMHQVKPFLGRGMRTIASNNTWFAWD